MSAEPCVWYIPSWPDSQVATDGISRVLVQEQKMTAPISSGSRPGVGERGLGGLQGDVLQRPLGVEPLLDPGLVADLLGRSSATSCTRCCGSGRRWCTGARP